MSREIEVSNVSVTSSTAKLLTDKNLCLKKIEVLGQQCELILPKTLANNFHISSTDVIVGFRAEGVEQELYLIIGSGYQHENPEVKECAFGVLATRMNRYQTRKIVPEFWQDVDTSTMQTILFDWEDKTVEYFIKSFDDN